MIGKTASCAAMALTVGAYVWPSQAHPVAVAAVVAVTAVNYLGVQKSAVMTRVIVVLVLAVLALVVSVSLSSRQADVARLGIGGDASMLGILQAAGLLFFAFAGYVRIATLAGEVRDPARTIPRAIPLALGITLLVYGLVAVAALAVPGSTRLGTSKAPLAEAVRAAGVAWAGPGRASGRSGRRRGVAAGSGAWRVSDHAGDRHRWAPPGCLGRRASSLRGSHRAEPAVGAVVAACVDVRAAIVGLPTWCHCAMDGDDDLDRNGPSRRVFG